MADDFRVIAFGAPIGPREGARPTLSMTGPQCQLDQIAPPALWGELVAAVFALPGVVEGHSSVSTVESRAVFVEGVEQSPSADRSLAPVDARFEPVHLHGVNDTSVHLVLHPARGRRLVALGWAEEHQHGEQETEHLVYGPRTKAELQVVLAIIRESLDWATG